AAEDVDRVVRLEVAEQAGHLLRRELGDRQRSGLVAHRADDLSAAARRHEPEDPKNVVRAQVVELARHLDVVQTLEHPPQPPLVSGAQQRMNHFDLSRASRHGPANDDACRPPGRRMPNPKPRRGSRGTRRVPEACRPFFEPVNDRSPARWWAFDEALRWWGPRRPNRAD